MKGNIMVNLLMKDFHLNKTNLAVNILIFTGLLAYFSFTLPVRLFVGFTCVMLSVVPLTLQAREDKFKATVLNCSLPVSRKTLVLSRYLNSWLLASASLIYLLAVAAVIPGAESSAEQLFNLDVFFLAFVIFSIVLSLLLPFVIRFGFTGLFALLLSVQLLGALLLMITVLFRSNMDRQVISAIVSGIGQMKIRLGEVGFRWIVIVLLMALNVISLKTSQALFERKDL